MDRRTQERRRPIRMRGGTAFSIVLTLSVLWAAAPASWAATPRDYVGRRIASVSLLLEGRVVTDPAFLDLIETRPGTRLTMEEVRESIVHLFSIGEFQDVLVEASETEDGVVLVYRLVPLPGIDRLAFRGNLALSARALRRALENRFGAVPPLARTADAVRVLEQLYRENGFMLARVEAVRPASTDAALLIFQIDSGPRARLSTIEVQGAPPVPSAQLLARVGLGIGQFYDPAAVERRLMRYADDLRDRGYYEAIVEHIIRIRDDGNIEFTLEIDPGPLVRVRFEGDPLPADRRDDLVPISREGSVDEDLLEDSARRIVRYLHGQGYWKAQVDYERVQTADALVVTFNVQRGDPYRVAGVEISGNGSVPAAEVQSLLTLRAGDVFVESRMDADVAAITEQYRRQGYSDVKLQSAVQEHVGRRSNGEPHGLITARIVIHEGTRTVVGTISFAGNSYLDDAELRSAIGAVPGGPFYSPQIAADRDGLLMTYLNRGFQNAAIDAEVLFSPDRTRADIVYRVSEGPQVIVEHILIVGNTRTNTQVIERELLLRRGQPLGFHDLVDSQRRLSALGLFRRVRITELTHGGGTSRDILVSVEEAPATTVGYGGGLEGGRRLRRAFEPGPQAVERLEFAPRGFFEIGRRNLWGKNRSVDLFTRVSIRPKDAPDDPEQDGSGLGFSEYRVLGSYREPRPFGWPADFLLTGFLEQAVRSSFNLNRRGVHAELNRRVTPAVSVTGRFTHFRNRLFDERFNPQDQPLIDRVFPEIRLSAVSGAIVRDTRDDPLDPAAGALIGLDAELAGRLIGSEVGFAKTFAQGFIYRRVHQQRRIVVAAGARLGLARAFDRKVQQVDEDGLPVFGPDGEPVMQLLGDIPASERFFAGGDTTVRGFAMDRLGDAATIDQDGFPKGGQALIVLNAELRLPLWRDVGTVAFLDAGNVFSRVADLNLNDLRRGAGFGVRYRSPIGPIRFDLGFKVPRLAGERLTALHISIGHAF